jgi:hypothetical protein
MFSKLSQCEDPSHCQSKSSFPKPSEKDTVKSRYTHNTEADKFVKSRYTHNTEADKFVKSRYTHNTEADKFVKSRLMWIE